MSGEVSVSEQVKILWSSLVEISDGKGRPSLRKLSITPTHLLVLKQSDDSDSTRPTHGSVSDRGLSEESSFESYEEARGPDMIKREVTLTRQEGILGISVRGGAEHNLPLIVSKVTPNSPAFNCKNIYVGDAIIAINGSRITRLDHDSAVRVLSSSGPVVKLKLKYYSTAKPYLETDKGPPSPSEVADNEIASIDSEWYIEKSIPLTFSHLSRYLGSTDKLRCNAFELKDATLNQSTGVVHCTNLNMISWLKYISDVVNGLNQYQTKVWSQETGMEIYYVGWVWEGTASGEEKSAWLHWKPKILALRGDSLYYLDYPPGICSDWTSPFSVLTTLLRLVNPDEQVDDRPHVFQLQLALENSCYPSTRTSPISLYLSTETRSELLRIEAGWTKAVKESVKVTKTLTSPVWWNKKPCQLELNDTTSSFNLYKCTSIQSPPLWTKPFAALTSSSDDSKTRLTLKFGTSSETFECRDLHRILFGIHSFLLAKVV